MYNICDHINQIKAYIPGKPIEEVERELGISNSIKLASNENPWGCSKLAISAMNKAIANINFYPDSNTFYLKNVLSDFNNLSPENIIIGNGSGEIIDIVMKIILSQNCNIVLGEYSFVLYRILASLYGTKINFAKASNFKNTAEELIRTCNNKTAMIIIDNPCNPTGQYLNFADLIKVIEFAQDNKILIFIDEAYYEYVRANDYKTTINLINNYDNLIVSRTFSKVYGLSGIRVGYGVANEVLIKIFEKARIPFNVNSLGQVAAIAALEDTLFVQETINKTHQGINYLCKELEKLGIDYIPTQGNFIMFKAPDIHNFSNKLLTKGIIIRPLACFDNNEYVRITIGTKEQNFKFIESIKTILNSEEKINV